MKPKLIILLLLFTVTTALKLHAQDYFDDIRGSGNPISLHLSKNFNASARLNIGDNSAKANLFKLWRTKFELTKVNVDTLSPKKYDSLLHCLNNIVNSFPGSEDFTCSNYYESTPSNFLMRNAGLGISVKGKTKDGLGALFSAGKISPESQIGAYGVWEEVLVKKDKHNYTFLVSPFINFNFASYRLLPDTSLSYKKLDTIRNTVSFGISAFRKSYIHQKSQIIYGLSLTRSKLNNWDDLSKVEMKETRTLTDGGTGTTGTITTVEDKGYTYGLGNLKEYNNTNFRLHVAWLPYALEYRVAVILYPSVDFNDLYDDPGYNIGVGLHFMEKGNPTMSIAGLFFELNDVNNSKDKTDPFLKRSFKVGVTTALNVSSLIKK